MGIRNSQNWPDLSALTTSCKDLAAEATRMAATFADATLRPLAFWIASKVRESAQLRADAGRLEFHDLLVLARRVLRDDADVRDALQKRFPVLLLDEFQDTDLIQIELAVRIAGGSDATQSRWQDVAIPAGSLFVVGDPKQSIYRFRRADIALFLDVRDRLNLTERLTTNFRTVAPVLAWVNQVFAEVIRAEPGMQPAYEPLTAHRHEVGSGPAVVLLGSVEHLDRPTASDLRFREAADVASAIAQALQQEWTIRDEAAGAWRPARLADMAILLPARTSLDLLEDALDAAGIAYRAESSSLVYQASEIRDLMAVARAVADPTDLLSTVTALRSPVFGCGDDDLWAWKHARGSFNLLARPGESQPDGAVRDGLDYLRGLHYRSRWMTPSELLTTVVADRRMLEVAAADTGPRARDQWRRLRSVLDQARAWSDTEHGGLRGYLAWAARQGQDGSRVAEAVLPETDLDAVRIMTIHAAKGLEFPIVLLSGMSSRPRGPGGVKLLWPSAGGYSVRLNKSVQTNDFEVNLPLDEQMDDFERRRLLYVAATRARDHLVVSLHRGGGAQTNARMLAESGAADAAGAVTFDSGPGAVSVGPRALVVSAPPAWREWHPALLAVRDAARRASSISASGLEGTEPEVHFAVNPVELGTGSTATPSAASVAEPAGAAKGPRDVELPPWSKGRYGTAIGRAVHGVLQAIDLAAGDGLDQVVAAQCAAEGVVAYTDIVRGCVRSALESGIVRRAATRRHWRESFVGNVLDDGTVVEGFVDLMYREDDGTIVVVDYKTDDIPAAAIGVRTEYYRPQINAYLGCLRASGIPGPRGVLLFLSPVRKAEARNVEHLR